MDYTKDAIYRIVYNSEDVDSIMIDLLIEIPELFSTIKFSVVKGLVTDYILSPSPISKITAVNTKFKQILKRHLDKGPIRTKKSSTSKMSDLLRLRAREAMKGICIDSNFINMLGCEQEYFRVHIEKQFSNNMTWENYGLTGWHIDHIEPLCSFDLTDPEQIAKATVYTNLRPLWSEENINKGRTEDKQKSLKLINKAGKNG